MSDSRDGARLVVVQIDDYGPWTTTPAPRRETDLQALQARLFATTADFFGDHDGYAFTSRYDNMIGVANGVDPSTFERLQERVRNRFPVSVSVGVGTARTPAQALDAAGAALQEAGSAQSADRREVLDHRVVDDATPGALTVAHFDVVDATGDLTDRVSPAVADRTVQRAVSTLDEILRDEHEAVTQFVGGDNVIAVCPSVSPDALSDVLRRVRERTGVDLQVGVGHGPTAHAAGDDAKHALEACRETGERVHGPWTVADD
ncbi:GTP cyclohydrolase IIa [Halorubellus salinus]|uniref:GTP cyclohydrolase IIa n=1 Tax=Halorubellus salinus TaxID=755309 RepID=UPI001D062EF6